MSEDPARAASLSDWPREPAALVARVQGLLLHEHFAPAYGETLDEKRRAGSHLRSVDAMLAALRALDRAPLSVSRPPGRRLVGVCRHFAVLTVAVLQAQGRQARARCGFGAFFNPGSFEDHWLVEFRENPDEDWRRLDAQLDPLQCRLLHVSFDPLDVPPEAFLSAGEAWRRCRRSQADPGAFGIFEMRGWWFIAGNLLRDVASLNGHAMLPWDCWGAMPAPDQAWTPDTLALMDQLADGTLDPAREAELRRCYESDARLRVPARVFNSLRQCEEPSGLDQTGTSP